MWRFLENVEPPPKKTKTEDEKKTVNKEYEDKKRERSFKKKWESEFPWILYDPINKTMYCKTCRAIFGPLSHSKSKVSSSIPANFAKYATGTFVIGTKNMKHVNLIDHSKSKGHQAADEHEKKRKLMPGTSTAEKTLETLNKHVFEKLDKLFRNAHAIAKNSRPIKDFVWMASLDEKKGVDVGKTYRNRNACEFFIDAIAEVERKKIQEQFDSAKFISVLSDGSTDTSVVENEIVYVRFAIKGQIYVYFAGLIQVQKADAKSIFSAIKRAITMLFGTDSSDILEKLIAFGSDGAAVNTGIKGGVITLMRTEIDPSILMVRCFAHKLELAYDAMKKIKLYDKISTLLSGVYAFYHKSPANRSNLKAAFVCLQSKPVYPTRIGGTRWVSHTLHALEKLLQAHRAIVMHLGQVKAGASESNMKAKATSLLKLLCTRDIIVYAHFLQDILAILSKLSLSLQREDASIYQCYEQLQAAKAVIKKYKTRSGTNLTKVEESQLFEGTSLTGNLTSFGKAKTDTVEGIIEHMDKRFAELDQDILTASKLVDLHTWPPVFVEDFGDEYVETLYKHFHNVLEKCGLKRDELLAQWTFLKTSLYNNHKVHDMTWQDINCIYQFTYSGILSLIDLVLTLPASSAQCERGFSHMKIVKSHYRSRLGEKIMNSLMAVKLHAAEIDQFDPSPAIHEWNTSSTKRRGPDFKENPLDVAHTMTSDLSGEAATSEEPKISGSMSDSDFDSEYSDYESDLAPDIFDLDEAACSDIE